MAKSDQTATQEQREELDRVATRLNGAILAFCAERIGRQFHADDLRRHVRTQLGEMIAPDSASRILRLLRQKKRVNYVVVNRRASLYQVLPLKPLKAT
jgi:hypothetical protein